MNLLWLIVLVLLVVTVFSSPRVGYWNHGWGWGPSGVGGFIVILLVLWLLFGSRL